ncbi:MAG: PadR family transcriptional regulator [Chitinophagales bacterium]
MNLNYAVLGLLHYKNLHGYRIRDHIEKHFGNMWSINPGQIYPVLRKLEEDGLITMVEVSQNGDKGPYRKLYAITEKGKAEFQRWLKETPDKGMELRDPFLTRFVFLGYGSRLQAVQLIEEQIEIYEKQYRQREENSERWSHQNIYVKLTAELGLTFNVMYLEWLKRAKEEIANHIEQDKQ